MYKSNNKTMLNKQITLITLSLLVAVFMISIFSFSSYANENNKNITLIVDGKTVVTDVSPVLISSRTMIPARVLFEEIGGTVNWDSNSKVVSISYKTHSISLTINSKDIITDGVIRTMDVPTQIYNGRTLIPLRFVAEALNFDVNWNPDTYTVTITTDNNTSPAETNPVETLNQIKKVSVTSGSTSDMYTSVNIEFTNSITNKDYTSESIINTNLISNPYRYFFDFNNVKVDKAYQTTLYTTSDGHSSVKIVRAALNTLTTYRLVFDLNIAATPTVTMSGDNKIMTIKFNKNSNYTEPVEVISTPVNSSTYNPYSDGKLVVVLDPGHGESTGGKRSPDGTLREYEFNRSVANRIKTILENNGIQVILTASDNTDVSLANRCNIANNSDADIFVSIHANAFGDGIHWEEKAVGWEIYYYAESSIGKSLANYIHTANIPDIGIKDRGVKTANFYVIKNTDMPSVLIEHGFFTSKTEVELLKSSSWRQKAAELDAKGIMNFLYSYKK